MKKLYLATLVATACFAGVPAHARDDVAAYSLDEALTTPEAKAKLDPGIKLYFSDQHHPKIDKVLYDGRTNKKTNGVNKSDKEACQWAFLSAVLELQERARKEGGDAVVQIVSNYKNVERSSATDFTCGSGTLMSGVALKGTVVKLAP